MYKVVEMPTGSVIVEFATHEECVVFIDQIESFEGYKTLKKTYGDTRRIQQELTIEMLD